MAKSKKKQWDEMTKKEKITGMSVLAIIVIIVIAVISSLSGGKPKNSNNTADNSTVPATSQTQQQTSSTQPAQPAQRQVKGTAVTLGAGTFSVGKDVAVGIYDVTPGAGQSGNFIVTGSQGTAAYNGGTANYNEVLGSPSDGDVSKVRAILINGEQVQISGLSSVTFTPVTAPLVTSHATTNLYSGTFVVGEDIGAGRYVATPASGESGNFMVDDSNGNNKVNEVLGSPSDGDVANVTVTLNQGDIITISGIDQVTLTASN